MVVQIQQSMDHQVKILSVNSQTVLTITPSRASISGALRIVLLEPGVLPKVLPLSLSTSTWGTFLTLRDTLGFYLNLNRWWTMYSHPDPRDFSDSSEAKFLFPSWDLTLRDFGLGLWTGNWTWVSQYKKRQNFNLSLIVKPKTKTPKWYWGWQENLGDIPKQIQKVKKFQNGSPTCPSKKKFRATARGRTWSSPLCSLITSSFLLQKHYNFWGYFKL